MTIFRILFFIFILCGSLFGHAASVAKIVGNKCLIRLEGAGGRVGDYFEALDLYGNPRGIVQLKKVRNGKAIAQIIEGTVGVDWIVEQVNRSTLAKTASVPGKGVSKGSVGLIIGGSYNTARKEDINSSRKINYSDFGGGGFAFFSYDMYKYFSVMFDVGISYVRLKENRSFDSSRSRRCRSDLCSAWIWWTPDTKATLLFKAPPSGLIQPWAGIGVGFNYWSRNDERYEIIGAPSFGSFHMTGHLSLGANFRMSKNDFYVPVIFNFNAVEPWTFFRGNADDYVSTYQMSVYIGIARSI